MTVHRNVVHHHPRMWRNKSTGRWIMNCKCGWLSSALTWHDGLCAALYHADTP